MASGLLFDNLVIVCLCYLTNHQILIGGRRLEPIKDKSPRSLYFHVYKSSQCQSPKGRDQ